MNQFPQTAAGTTGDGLEERGASPRGYRSKTTLRIVGGAVLAVAVLLVYYPAASGPFIFDDAGTIVDNPSVRQLWPLVGSENNPGPLNPSDTSAVHGRPIVNLTFAANYYFGTLDPFGYRLVNIIIHLLSTILLWAIVARTLRLDFFRRRFDLVAEPLAFVAALVWMLHPLNTECVVYVTQRTELMMGMFYLATLYGSIRYWNAESKTARVTCLTLTALACLSGMLSKEMMASAPAMVLLYERTFIAGSFRRALRQSWPLYLGLALTWLSLVALNLNGPRTPASGFGLGVAAHHWWFTQAQVLFLYLKLAIWPWPLVIHYEVPYLTTIAQAWPWLLAVGLLAVGTLVLFWRRSSVAFVAIWIIAVLSPTLVIPLVNEIVAERRMYVPLAAIVPFLIVGGYVVLERVWLSVAKPLPHDAIHRGPMAAFVVVTILLVIAFGCVSSHRLLAYREELTLWQDAVLHQPHDPMVQFNLGTLLVEAGRVPKAIGHLQEAVRLDPESYESNYNLARAFEDTSRPQDAATHYREALRLRPEDPASHYNLARLLEEAGELSKATDHYRQAVAAQSDFPAAHTNLGILLLNAGHTKKAIEHFEAALQGQEDTGNCINLAMAYSVANRMPEALTMAGRAVELARDPNETSLAKQALTYLRTEHKKF
jgi:tetratricopeptide (TPR) repeat protein